MAIDFFSFRIISMAAWLFVSLAVIIVFGIMTAYQFHISYAAFVTIGFISLILWFILGKKLMYN